MQELLTVREVADRLKVNVMTIYRRVWRGELKSIRIGRLIRIPVQEMEKLLKQRKNQDEQE